MQSLEVVHEQAAAAQAAHTALAQRAVQCKRALGRLQAALPLPVACPDICGLLGRILRKMGRSERSEERAAQLLDRLSCAVATAACQASSQPYAMEWGSLPAGARCTPVKLTCSCHSILLCSERPAYALLHL